MAGFGDVYKSLLKLHIVVTSLSHRRCISSCFSNISNCRQAIYRVCEANISTLLLLGGGCCFCYSCHFQRGIVGTGCAVSATNRHIGAKISIPSVGAAIGRPYFYGKFLSDFYSLHPLAAGAFLCPERQRKQNALIYRGPKEQKITAGLLFIPWCGTRG